MLILTIEKELPGNKLLHYIDCVNPIEEQVMSTTTSLMIRSLDLGL